MKKILFYKKSMGKNSSIVSFMQSIGLHQSKNDYFNSLWTTWTGILEDSVAVNGWLIDFTTLEYKSIVSSKTFNNLLTKGYEVIHGLKSLQTPEIQKIIRTSKLGKEFGI